MKFEKYGVTFRELEHCDIEMVRQWRNDPEVSRYAVNREIISPEMQEEWFRGIESRNEKHLVLNFDGKDVGLWTIKNINTEEQTGECGVYFAIENDRNSYVPYLVSLGVEDFIKSLGVRKVKVYILDENKRAIRYNKSLGFVPTEFVTEENARVYWLDLNNNERYSKKLKKILKLND